MTLREIFKNFIIGVCMIAIPTILFTACGSDFDEGDDVAAQRFEKFTSQEKTIYKAVQDVWGQRLLKYVREAVGKREARPAEDMLPFKDIANVIKSNNSASLKLDSTWKASTKNKYIKGRWDRVDEKWYRDLMLSMGVTEVIKQDLVPEPVEEVIPDTKEESSLEPHIYGDQPYVVEQNNEVKIINSKDIISINDYDDLYFNIKKCPSAIKYYNKVIEERLITHEDIVILTQLATKCKAIKIGEKLN